MTMTAVSAFLAALGAGSVVSYFVTGAPQRRKSRAEVRRSVLMVERLRMTGANDEEYRDAIREVIATALVARVPRDLVDSYVYSRRASWALTKEKREERGEHSPLYISRDVSQYLVAIGELLVDYLWQPTRTRLRLRQKLRALSAEREALLRQDREGHGDGHFLGLRYWDV